MPRWATAESTKPEGLSLPPVEWQGGSADERRGREVQRQRSGDDRPHEVQCPKGQPQYAAKITPVDAFADSQLGKRCDFACQ